MSSGWILIDKADGGLVRRKVDTISDTVQSHLQLIQRGEDLDDKTRNDYKKRKLVEEVIEKIYIVKKGPNFSTTIKKIPTELTAEMIQSGSWKSTQLKDYNLDSMGVVPEAGCLHPLLKVRQNWKEGETVFVTERIKKCFYFIKAKSLQAKMEWIHHLLVSCYSLNYACVLFCYHQLNFKNINCELKPVSTNF